MKLLLSAPSGYNTRELLLPLSELLAQDEQITAVAVITPAAEFRAALFPDLSDKFTLHANPASQADHDQLIKKLAPNVVVTPTFGLDVLDTPILRAAKNNNIPTCVFVASWDNVFKMDRLLKKGYSGTHKYTTTNYEMPDHFAVWNAMNQEHLIHSFPDYTSDRVTIVGSPRFDYFSHHNRIPSKSALYDYLGLSEYDRPLLHGATTELYPFDYIIKQLSLAAAAKELPDNPYIYASVHPGGDLTKHQHYQDYGATVRYSFGRRDDELHPNFKYLPTTAEIYLLIALFKYTSVLINQSSTVAIESMAADVPILNVKYGRSLDWWGWYRSMVYRDFQQHYLYITEEGGTTVVTRPKQLIPAITRYFEHPEYAQAERAKTITKMISYTDGSASQRLIDVVKRVASS